MRWIKLKSCLPKDMMEYIKKQTGESSAESNHTKVHGGWLEVTQLVFSITSFYSSLFSIKAYKPTATTVPPRKE